MLFARERVFLFAPAASLSVFTSVQWVARPLSVQQPACTASQFCSHVCAGLPPSPTQEVCSGHYSFFSSIIFSPDLFQIILLTFTK